MRRKPASSRGGRLFRQPIGRASAPIRTPIAKHCCQEKPSRLSGPTPKSFRIPLVFGNPRPQRLFGNVPHGKSLRRLQKYPALTQFHQDHGIHGGFQSQPTPDFRGQCDRSPLAYRNCCHAAILQHRRQNVKQARCSFTDQQNYLSTEKRSQNSSVT